MTTAHKALTSTAFQTSQTAGPKGRYSFAPA